MDYNINELRIKIDGYFNGTVTKNELGSWASFRYKEESQNLYLKINELFNQTGQTNTILDMLEERIVKIIKAIFEITDDDIQLKRRIRLYGNKSEHRNIVDKLMEYLDYYLGEKMFNVLVFYENGVPDLEIL